MKLGAHAMRPLTANVTSAPPRNIQIRVGVRSTSVIAQYQAALCGHALAILPCFVAEPDPRLVALLPEQIQITRQFWLYYREDLRRLRRITLVTDYLRACTDANRDFLLGETRTPVLGWPTP